MRIMLAGQQIECPGCAHHDAPGYHCGRHVVRVLPGQPWIGEQTPEALKLDRASACDSVSDRMLHPCVGGDDEIAGQPGTDEDEKGRYPMKPRSEAFLAEQKEAQKA